MKTETMNLNQGLDSYIEPSEALKTYLKWAKNISDLKRKIASAYRDILNQDVIIQLNGEIVVYTHETLYESTFIRSYVRSYDIRDLKIKIIAGMGNGITQGSRMECCL